MIQVLDTSVAVKWFCPEDETTTTVAVEILEQIKHDPKVFAVPDLFYSECLHVLYRKLEHDISKVAWAMDRLFRLSLQPLHFDSQVACRIAKEMNNGLSGYDATYYAFAALLKGHWLTFDQEAGSKVSNPRYIKLLI